MKRSHVERLKLFTALFVYALLAVVIGRYLLKMENNLIEKIKKEINYLNAIRRGFEYDVSNMAHPAEHLEIFEKELDEIKKELIYVKKVLKFAKANAI